MRTVAITAISLALVTLYACGDNDNATTPSNSAGAAGNSSHAGAAGEDAGSAGAVSTSDAGANSLESAGTATGGGDTSGGAASAGVSGGGATGGGDTNGGAASAGVSGGGDTNGGAASAGVSGGGDTNGGAASAGVSGSGVSGGATSGGGGVAGNGQAPASPSSVAIDTTSSDFGVTVSWTDTANDETGFNVYLSTDETKPSTPTATVAAGTLAYDLTQVMAATTYRAWIEAVNAVGVSSAVQVTASAPTTDFTWDDLYYDEAAGAVHLAVEDSYGFLTDGSAVSGLFGYHSASPSTMGSAQALDPAFTYPVTTSGIDITVPQYFWVEARSPSGSLFSLRTLSPAGTVSNLQTSTDASNATLTWDATVGATAYEVSYGTGAIADATRLADTATTTAVVPALIASTQYYFWVSAKAPAIGGFGFPGVASVAQGSTTP